MARSPGSSMRPGRRGAPGRPALLASGSVLLLALTACGPDDLIAGPPGPHATPTSAGQCSDLPLVGSDGGMVLGTDWSSETHPYDRPVDLTICVTTSDGARVRVRSPDAGVRVSPGSQQVPGAGNGLLTVRVRVASGTPSGTTLRVQQDGPGVVGDTSGPSIVTTADGWHFDGS